MKKKGPMDAARKVMDKLVDMNFPIAYTIEERIQGLERHGRRGTMSALINETFIIRGDLLHLHHTITPMRELLYRILESTRIPIERLFHTLKDKGLECPRMFGYNRYRFHVQLVLLMNNIGYLS